MSADEGKCLTWKEWEEVESQFDAQGFLASAFEPSDSDVVAATGTSALHCTVVASA